jgi:hypothetical protein
MSLSREAISQDNATAYLNSEYRTLANTFALP